MKMLIAGQDIATEEKNETMNKDATGQEYDNFRGTHREQEIATEEKNMTITKMSLEWNTTCLEEITTGQEIATE